jgi:hypothetical protein
VDEAFIPLHRMVVEMAAHGDIRDDDLGIHMYVDRLTVETPIELDVSVRDDGTVAIGSVPPLYRVATTLRPSYHRIEFRAELTEMGRDG